MTPQEYCQNKTAASGSSFYYSFLFLPHETRRAITALYAFCREVDDVVDECTDASVAEQKLDWWRHEIDNSFAGQAQHPVGLELQRLVPKYGLPIEHFTELINGMEMDLHKTAYRTMDELRQYCYRAASVVGLLAAKLFGYEDSKTESYAHDLGMAFQLTNIIRDVKEDAARGRIYLPQDLLDHYSVTATDLVSSTATANLKKLLANLADQAEGYYVSAEQALPEADRWNQRSGLIMSAIYHALLDKIRARQFEVMRGRVSVSPWSKLWIAWRTARKENQRHRHFLKSATSNAA
jgi:phytoene synthase